jgi:hypothetical protein
MCLLRFDKLEGSPQFNTGLREERTGRYRYTEIPRMKKESRRIILFLSKKDFP